MPSPSIAMLPLITTLPIDGYGGSYYDFQFPVPVYNHDAKATYETMSWSDVDYFYRTNATRAIEIAVSFGVCVATLLNLIVLTPQHKRKLPLHSFICLALVFQVIRNATDMVLATKSVWVSSYVSLTADVGATTLSRMFYAIFVLNQASACLAFAFVQGCFFIQAQALMTWLRLHRRSTFYAVSIYLVLTGVTALSFRTGLAVIQVMYVTVLDQPKSSEILSHGQAILAGISIGSWSMVFFVSAISIIISRRRVLLKTNNVYTMALNVIAIVGIQSFIVPILFCILQFLPVDLRINQPEQLIMPSVLYLLPIGTLFMSVHGKSGGGRSGSVDKAVCASPCGQNPHSSLSDESRHQCPSARDLVLNKHMDAPKT